MMCGSSTAAAASASWMNRCRIDSSHVSAGGSTLSATHRCSRLSRARKTIAIPPEPIFFSRRYPAITEPGSKPAGKLPPGPGEKSLTMSSGARPRLWYGLDRYPEHGSSVGDDNGLAGHQRALGKTVRHGPGERAVGGPPGGQAPEVVAGVDHARADRRG